MRLKSILSKDPGQNTQLMRQCRYSPAGNVTEKETGHGSYTYQYDKLYRLIHAANPTQNDESYTYDFLGNRLSSSSTTGTWNYNANNELLGYDSVSFTYDANGNTVQKNDDGSITDYSYDIEDRLVEVTTNDPQPTTSKYYYDPFGRRLWKEVDGTRTYFVYSDEGLVGEYDSTGQELRTYGWIPGSRWSTNPLFVKIAGVYYWYRNDHLGTPQKIVTTSGAVVWEAVYDSFGNCQVEVEAITNDLRFPGQYYDSETGLLYNLNRYYDSTTGRYLRADPFGAGLNLYTYCFNNPLGLIDPLGLCAVENTWNVLNDPQFYKNLVKKFDKFIMAIPIDSIGINAGTGGTATLFNKSGPKGALSTAVIIDTHGNIAIISTKEAGIGVVVDHKYTHSLFVNAVVGINGAGAEDYLGYAISLSGTAGRLSGSYSIPLANNPGFRKAFVEIGYVPGPTSLGGKFEGGMTLAKGEGLIFKNPLQKTGEWWGNFFYDLLH